MHLDGPSLLCGFMLGCSTYLCIAGVALVRRGVLNSPKAWSNPNLSARTQGKGLILCAAVMALIGLAFLISTFVAGPVLVVGIGGLYLLDRRYKRQPAAQEPPTERTSSQEPPSGT